LEEIEAAGKSRVEQLQLNYGNRECMAQDGTPSFNINDLFEQLEGDKVTIYRAAARNFFFNKENQEKYGFSVLGQSGVVMPT
jgi:hypothetical protein